jgi:hypothetical protein
VRVLCDQNVANRYIKTFSRTDWITVSTVREELSSDADDRDISTYAAANDWIVFTGDDDFRQFDHDRGLLLYSHIERPSPGDVLDALQAIAEVYPDHRKIDQNVPDGWV